MPGSSPGRLPLETALFEEDGVTLFADGSTPRANPSFSSLISEGLARFIMQMHLQMMQMHMQLQMQMQMQMQKAGDWSCWWVRRRRRPRGTLGLTPSQ
jgi:hypothetical protein